MLRKCRSSEQWGCALNRCSPLSVRSSGVPPPGAKAQCQGDLVHVQTIEWGINACQKCTPGPFVLWKYKQSQQNMFCGHKSFHLGSFDGAGGLGISTSDGFQMTTVQHLKLMLVHCGKVNRAWKKISLFLVPGSVLSVGLEYFLPKLGLPCRTTTRTRLFQTRTFHRFLG